MNKYVKKCLKITAWIFISIVILFLSVILLLQIPYVQNLAKDKAVAYLESKIHTPVSIGRIEIGFPKKIIIEAIYLQSQQGDTLLAGKEIAVDISLFKLLRNQVEINSVDLKGIVANIRRDKDSVFNFDYIVDAFVSTEPEKTDSKPMTFSINDVALDDIKVRFDDAITKNNLEVNLFHFDTQITNFDIDKMDFSIPKIAIDGLNLRLTQGKLIDEIASATVQKADSIVRKRPDLNIDLGKIALRRIKVSYDNDGTQLNTGLTLEKLLLSFEKTDLPNQNIVIDDFRIDQLTGKLAIGKYSTTSKIGNTNLTNTTNDWKVLARNVEFKSINFKYDNLNVEAIKNGIDYNHLDLMNLNFKGNSLRYQTKSIEGKINSFAAVEKSGLVIQTLRTDFLYSETASHLKNLYIKTPQSVIQEEIRINYTSLEGLQKNPGEMALDATIRNSRIAVEDILFFAPNLRQTNPFKEHQNAILSLSGRIKGKLKNFDIENLQISGIGETKLVASGKVIGLPNLQKSYYDLKIPELRSSAKDIYSFVSKENFPTNIALPSQLALRGNFKGSIENFNTNLNLNSSFGAAKLKGNFDQRNKNAERYNGEVALDYFDVGKLLKNKSIGKICLKAKVGGIGLNPKTANANVEGNLIKANFNNYTYRNLALHGNIARGKFTTTAKMDDPNLDFDMVAEGDFDGKYPAVKMKLNIDIADLEKLNLHAGALKLRGKMDADIATADADYLNGNLSIYHLVIATPKEQFQLDSIKMVATTTADRNLLVLKSQFLNAKIDGKYQLTNIGNALTNSIAKYYGFNPIPNRIKTESQRLTFELNMVNDPVIMQLLPQIKRIEPIKITGRYNSLNDTIILNADIPRLVYGTNTITNGLIKVETIDNSLVYSAVIDEIKSTQFQLPHTSIEGTVQHNTLVYRLNLKDAKDIDQYIVAGALERSPSATELHLYPEELLLNYERWLIADNNVVRFGSKGIYADNFELSNKESAVTLQSQSESVNAPLSLDFKAFDLATLTQIVRRDSLAVAGKVNGNLLLKNLTTKPVFTSDLSIENLTVKNDTVGNIKIQVNNEIDNRYSAKVAITGSGNQVNLDGYYQNDNSSFDMDLDIQQLNVVSIQPFTVDNISKSSGFVSGKFKIQGTTDTPQVIGDMQFHDVGFTATKFNAPFKLRNENVNFTEQGMVFSNFSLSDASDNVLSVKGKIDTPNYRDYAFDLNLNADNFQAVNSTSADNDLYYGKLFLNSRLRITGDLNNPVVDGTIKVNKETLFTIVLPQNDPSIVDREGIVEFIDQDNLQSSEKLMTSQDSLTKTALKGMNVAVNIEIDKKAELTMVIDKGNGDFVNVKGEAQLSGGIDESGKTTLTGRYELQEGSYEMTFNFLKRKFDIQKGSYILWTGEPMSAEVNITAVYTTETAPLDLLDDQLGDMSQATRNTYKQKLPFETKLKLNGELLKPVITFDIDLPEGNYGVSQDIVSASRAKLEQLRQEPAELNKQVFALLLLNRFIGENPFASETGTSTESFARQSVSKILSEQLNALAGDLIKGVDVNFVLESTDDYTSGERQNKTDLNVEVSKRLLNDRLKVTVGSSFGVEGEQQANQQTNSIAGDVAVDYQLSKDGRYVLRGYRKNEYQVALQGQVIETGVAFIITMDYNKFKELFQRTAAEKRANRKMKKKQEELAAQRKLETSEKNEALKQNETEKK